MYSDANDTWTVAPSELTRLLGRPASDVPGLWSRSPSGELQAYIGARDVVVRRGNGPWESTGAAAWSVVATNEAVYTLGPDDPDLVRIWPTS